jgi:hypothetical protein
MVRSGFLQVQLTPMSTISNFDAAQKGPGHTSVTSSTFVLHFSLPTQVGPGEVDEELEEEVGMECANKYGAVTGVLIFEVTQAGYEAEEAVRIFVQVSIGTFPIWGGQSMTCRP